MEPGPDGVLRPAGGRRRFPHLALVFVGYGLLTPAACAGVAALFELPPLRVWAPQRLGELPLPPQPSLDNLLFGAGLHETVLAGGLAGLLLWRFLWRQRPAPRKTPLRALLPLGLLYGPVFAGVGLAAAAFGLFLRSGPAEIPGVARPFFALLSVPFTVMSALATGVVPLTLLALGLLFGVATAVAVALAWPHFPEEPPR